MIKKISLIFIVLIVCIVSINADILTDILKDSGYSSVLISSDTTDCIVACELPDSSNEGSIHAGVVFALTSAALQFPDTKNITVRCLVENTPVIEFSATTEQVNGLINQSITGEKFLASLNIALPAGDAKPLNDYKKVFGEYFNPDSTWFKDNSAFIIKDGLYIIYPRDMDRFSYNNEISFRNGKIAVDTEWRGGIDNYGYGVIMRQTDNTHYYYLLMAGVGYYVLGYINGQKGGKLINWTQSPLINQHGKNHVEVITEEDRITVMINGNQLCSVVDSQLDKGACGMYVSKDVQAAFDNFEIYTK